MGSTELLEFFGKVPLIKYIGVEDFADKFNFFYSLIVLMLCCVLTTIKQYVFKPISCYLATVTGGHNPIEYVENYCWVQGTVPRKMSERLPETEEEWEALQGKKILYYQWVPFMLAIQCIMFCLPGILWKLICHNRTGTDLDHIVASANQAAHSDSEERAKMVKHLSHRLEQMFFHHRMIRNSNTVRAKVQNTLFRVCSFCMVSKRLGTWLVFGYIFIKICYLINSVGQLYIMQHFLGFCKNSTYTLFGVEILSNILHGRDWEVTELFPRVTYCYVPVRTVGNTNAATAQCVLPSNMLNEKIYIFLWFWIVIASILTIISIPIWFARMANQKGRRNFIKKFLKVGTVYEPKEKLLVDKFVRQFLRHDGVFMLEMIAINAGDILTTEIVCKLWQIYRGKYKNKNFLDCSDDGSLATKVDRIGASCLLNEPTAPEYEDHNLKLIKQQSVDGEFV